MSIDKRNFAPWSLTALFVLAGLIVAFAYNTGEAAGEFAYHTGFVLG